MKRMNKKIISTSISLAITWMVCSALPMASASDISIYADSTKGKASILLMLDTSGSMGISSLVMPRVNSFGSPGDIEGQSLCNRVKITESGSPGADYYSWAYNLSGFNSNGTPVKTTSNSTNATAIEKSVSINGTTITYHLRGCTNGTTWQYDRLSRLKDAIIPLLAGNKLDNNVIMGVGQFSAKTDLNISGSLIKLIDSHSGAILVENAALSSAQRIKLAQKIAAFQSLDNITYGNGKQSVGIHTNGREYIVGSAYTGANVKKSSTTYPLGTGQYKTAGGTPTAQAYAEAGAYMMGTNTGVDTSTSTKIDWIYDGSMTMQKIGADEQVHFICVELGSNLTSSDFMPTGVTRDVKQCINNWPNYSGNSVTEAVINSGVYKPNGIDATGKTIWYKFKNRTELEKEMPKMSNGWETLSQLPEGWRYGGWMKVAQEPLDIEPIVGKSWGPYANGSAFGIVAYRTNPFALVEKNTTNASDSYTDNLVGGFKYSITTSKNGSNYIAGGSTSACDGNGIYMLTDGAPNSTKDNIARSVMNHSLLSNTYQFSGRPSGSNVLTSPTLKSNLFVGETGGWEYIGEYSKKLADPTKNPKQMKIKTAIVGFGASFEGLTKNADGTYDCDSSANLDIQNACKWGSSTYGNGGFYQATNSDDIALSIVDFVRKVEVNIDPVVTGNPVIPVDALNPTELQTEAYYATFEPKVSSTNPLWIGNLNKYRIKDGELYSANGSERLISTNGSLNKGAYGYWADGVLGVLQAGASKQIDPVTQENKIKTHRTIYTDKDVSASALRIVDINSLFDSGYFTNDVNKNYWLNVLGYRVGATEGNLTKDKILTTPVGKQLGAVMHSTPVLLTQEGRINVTSGTLTSSERKDYLMFGSTQGILHVVDTSTGEEVFGFVPNEMMNNQKAAFLLDSKEQTAAGMSGLFYGIDAPWVAHTKYTTTSNGLLTVKDSGRKASDEDDSENLKGYQWVYGGLRMGGKSYYALDVSDLTNPKLKFHINPSPENESKPLQRMGQSWSKPTIGYVKWGGKKKLVMFVGGGYDATGPVTCTSDTNLNNKGYECPTYAQTNKAGAGVYMFDANNGELLWWSSVDNNDTPASSTIRFTANTDLQYSVVSQINAVDRNADGLIDHLYFGDLAGQAFRVDLDNTIQVTETQKEDAAKNKFAKRVVTLFSEHVATGLSPRFYEMPSVSTHKDDGKLFAAVAFSSGNRSTPLADNSASANDGVFVFYDRDIADVNLFTPDYTLKTSKNNLLQNLDLKVGVPLKKNGEYVGGWKYPLGETAGTYKGMNDLYALDSMLYVNVYHKDGAGISGSCGGGVKGDSYLFQYCLPFGKCNFYTASTTNVNKVKLGAGILGTSIGKGYKNQNSTLSLVVNRDNPSASDCSKPENKNLPQCQLFNNPVSLKQLRWYEAE